MSVEIKKPLISTGSYQITGYMCMTELIHLKLLAAIKGTLSVLSRKKLTD